jgi:hypothetical protein
MRERVGRQVWTSDLRISSILIDPCGGAERDVKTNGEEISCIATTRPNGSRGWLLILLIVSHLPLHEPSKRTLALVEHGFT